MLKNHDPAAEFCIRKVSSDHDLIGILQLQKKNLASALSPEELTSQGFVTVQHTMDILRMMHEKSPSLVAKFENEVVGYALVMTAEHKACLPILEPMFRLLDEIKYDSSMISTYNYFVMGQICIEKTYRGLGLFDRLYQGLQQHLSNEFELMITEVASRNQRSIHAHQRVGLSTIHKYKDLSGEEWEIKLWDWRQKKALLC